MKIAISAETNNGLESKVAGHFGRCPFFALVELDDTEVKTIQLIANPYFAKHQPGQIPEFIKAQGAEVMISGGMGGRAMQFFDQLSVQTATGASGTVKFAIERFLKGELGSSAPCKESVEHGHAAH